MPALSSACLRFLFRLYLLRGGLLNLLHEFQKAEAFALDF